jgi:hypothetical protein
MKESSKKRILGSTLYSVYRRIRFLRYKKKLLNRQKQLQTKIRKEVKTIRVEKIKPEKKTGFFVFYRIYRIVRFLAYKRAEKKREQREIAILLKKEQEEERKNVKERLKEKQKLDGELARIKAKEAKQYKRELKYRRRRLIKYVIKKQFKYLVNDIRNFNVDTVKKWFRWLGAIAENRERRKHFLIIAGNALVMFLLAYLLIYIIAQTITVFVALNFDYKVILFYHKIYYAIDANDWSADSVKILFSIPPFTGLVIGIISIVIFSSFQNEGGLLKLFFLWMFIHGMNMFFGSLLVGTLLNKGFGWVIAYLYYMDTGKMVFSILSIFGLVLIGGIVAKSFLISGNSYFNYLNRENRKFLLYSQVLIPSLLGTLILILLKIPNNFYYTSEDEALYEALKLSAVILVLIPIIMSFRSYNEIYFDEEPRKFKLLWKLFIFTVLFVIAVRFGLQEGLYFGE